jgi:hypothetical protein
MMVLEGHPPILAKALGTEHIQGCVVSDGPRCDSKSHLVLLYQCQYIPRLLYTAQVFFKNQFFDKSFSQTRHKLFFKIDYYDNDMRYRSEDPSDHSRASPY